MALESPSLLRAVLLLLLAAQALPSVSGCDRRFYDAMIDKLCLAKFEVDMGGLDRGRWCSWTDTAEIYEGLTNCTYQVALRLDCFWPNQVVDGFFMRIHRDYFPGCALTGRLLGDPPIRVLAPFIAVPVLVTLLMTAVVVWRSKHTEGVL